MIDSFFPVNVKLLWLSKVVKKGHFEMKTPLTLNAAPIELICNSKSAFR
jgi:hypothetical protein